MIHKHQISKDLKIKTPYLKDLNNNRKRDTKKASRNHHDFPQSHKQDTKTTKPIETTNLTETTYTTKILWWPQ